MDMELQRMVMEGYRPVSQGMFSQEETLESIVPDAFPDISRIVSAPPLRGGQGLFEG